MADLNLQNGKTFTKASILWLLAGVICVCIGVNIFIYDKLVDRMGDKEESFEGDIKNLQTQIQTVNDRLNARWRDLPEIK